MSKRSPTVDLLEAARASAREGERQIVRDYLEASGAVIVLRGTAAVDHFRKRATHMWQGHFVRVLPDLVHGKPCQHGSECPRKRHGGCVEIWGDWFGGKWVEPSELEPLRP